MKKILPIIFLTIISAFLIFYRFADIPKYLSFDEVEFTKLALSLNNKPYIPYSPLATGHSTLYFYILLASLKIFGITTFALRLPAAIFGILSVLLFYLIMEIILKDKKILNTYYLILTTLILLTSHWFLNFSRFSFEATFLLFLEITSIYFLIKANVSVIKFLRLGIPRFLRGGFPPEIKILLPNIYIFVSGLFAGFAFLSYTPGRIFFALPIGYLIYDWYRRGMPRLYKNIIKTLFIFLIPFLIVITPLSSYLLTHNDTRVDQQFFFKNSQMTIQEKAQGLWHNISSTALMFNIKGDVNGRHNYPNKPALNPILGILFLIGLVLAVKDFKNIFNKLFLLYFFISLFPSLLTYPWENPNMLRTFTVLPSVIYFVGIAIYHLDALARRSFSEGGAVFKYLILITFYLILAFSCFYELRTYFKYQSTVFNQAFEIKLPLDQAIKTKLKP